MLLQTEGCGFSNVAADWGTYNIFPSSSLLAITTTGGPFGDNYIAVDPNFPCPMTKTADLTTFFVGLRVRLVSASTAPSIQFLSKNGTVQFTLCFNNNTGIITAFRGTSGGTLIGTSSAGLVPFNSWFYLEIGATISTTVGTIEVHINGANVWTLSGLNNQADTGTASQNQVLLGGSGTIHGGFSFTHYYLCDSTGSTNNTFLGDVRVQTVFPASNDVVQFTPVGLASNFNNAAKIPPVPATDYNTDGTLNDQDTFNCGTVAASTTTIFGVNVKGLVYRADAGNRTVAMVVKSSGTTVASANLPVNFSTQQATMVQETDPATGSAWSLIGANAMKIGYKVTN